MLKMGCESIGSLTLSPAETLYIAYLDSFFDNVNHVNNVSNYVG